MDDTKGSDANEAIEKEMERLRKEAKSVAGWIMQMTMLDMENGYQKGESVRP